GSAASTDGGRHWTVALAPFTMCAGGAWKRTSDPWVTISPDGAAYQAALVFDGRASLRSGLEAPLQTPDIQLPYPRPRCGLPPRPAAPTSPSRRRAGSLARF